MQRFAFIDSNGLPAYSASPSIDGAYIDGDTYGDYVARELPSGAPDDLTVLSTYYYKSGSWHTRIPRPGAYYDWNNTTEAWVANLSAAKAAKNAEIDAAREAANKSGFTYSGTLVGTDPASRSYIDGVNGYIANTGALPTSWPGSWKGADDTYVTISSVSSWKSLHNAMVLATQENYIKSEYLKSVVAAATTVALVETVEWY